MVQVDLSFPIMDIASLRADFATNTQGLRVDRENVLKVRSVVGAEAVRLDRALAGARLLKMDLCGGDPVSEDAAAAFTERAQLLIDHYFEYVSDLYELAEKLGGSAKAYGYSEDEIEQSFKAPS